MSGRELEYELLEKLRQYVSDTDILNNMLGYFNSDETIAALKSACDDYDIDYEEYKDE